MTTTCPLGHASATDDYCDQCGAPLAGAPTATVTPGAATDPLACGNCGTPHEAGDAFCEVCGLDFATGQLPAAPPLRAAAPAPPPPADPSGAATGWVAVVGPDRAFFATNRAETGAVAFPEGVAARDVPLRGDEVLIGRRSDRSGHFPDIDCGTPVEDPGVSRRHAVLRRAGEGWEIVDAGSTNGTRVNGALLGPGVAVAVGESDVVHVGAWTRVILRPPARP